MTYSGGEFSFKDLYEELKEQAVSERIEDIGQYKEMMENLLEEKKSYGFLDESEDWPQMAHDLMLKWPEVERELKKHSGKLVS